MRRGQHDDRAEKRRATDTAHDRLELPDGVELLASLRGHDDVVGKIAWSPDGSLLATPSRDRTVSVWDGKSLGLVHAITKYRAAVRVAAFDRLSHTLATASDDHVVRLWEVGSWRCSAEIPVYQCKALAFSPLDDLLLAADNNRTLLINVLTGEIRQDIDSGGWDVAFNSSGTLFVVNSFDSTIVWDARDAHVVAQETNPLTCMTFAPDDDLLAGVINDVIELWDYRTDAVIATIEGHTDSINGISFMADGRLMASKSDDNTVRLWDCRTWTQVAVIPEPSPSTWMKGIAFHPSLPLLATVGTDPGSRTDDVVHIWRLDIDRLLASPLPVSLAYKSAKIVLVGESGAGKTGLAHRLASGEFTDHASTHGQQFWLLDALGNKRADDAQCEAVLWDLAGQPDYRIIHALFIDDADVALIVFDPTRDDDPLQGVDYWLSQLDAPGPRTTTGLDREVILVAARADRGTARLTTDEIARFCADRGVGAHIVTSARTGEGIDELVRALREAVHWDLRPPTITTRTFQWIKATVLGLKEDRVNGQVILSPAELRDQLTREDPAREFTDAEMLAAVAHLANHGYVALSKTSRGESRIVLAPELLNNVAASMVLEARRNPKGLGSLAEQSVLDGDYSFPELNGLAAPDREVLLDSAIAMFLAHNVCFRETDPLSSRVYLVFPELINLRRPTLKNPDPTDEGLAYTVAGAVENIYASLVVLLGFTDVFTRTNQWRNQAEYRVGDNLTCGFRLDAEREGELDFVLYFGTNVGEPIRLLFQGLFESFLAGRNLTVHRLEPVLCGSGHQLNRAVVREHLATGRDQAYCNRCGDRIALPRADAPVQLTRTQSDDLMAERRTVDLRSQFEQALFRLHTYAARDGGELTCFISYAWGNQAHESWVEQELATDLAKAGVAVLLDRWENARIGASVARFVERAGRADRVIVVGTPLYLTKYDNDEPMGGFVVAAEGDLIGARMLGTESLKQTVLPILLEGAKENSLPLLLQGRVFSDFREPERYFASALDLILSLHGISPRDPVSIELRQSVESWTR